MSKGDKKTRKPNKPKKAATKDRGHNLAVRTVSFGRQTYHFNDITKVHPALKSFICYNLNKLAYRKKLHLEKALEPLGIHAIHSGVLKLVGMGQNISQNQLSDEIGLDKATMVKVVDHLESRKLVERRQSPRDRRVNFIQLTAKGKKVLGQALKISDQVEEEFLSPLSKAEIESFKDILVRLLDRPLL